MVLLCTADGPFHARVLVARLGAEGILAVQRGASDGPYPLSVPVEVLVPFDELATAREILLFDDLEAPDTPLPRPAGSRQRVFAAVVLVVVALTVLAEAARLVADL
jgi:hypothetical protein